MLTLVTGGSGFTGHYVKQQLEKCGHRVHSLASDLTNYSDVAAEINLIQPAAVIHLAAISFVGSERVDEFYTVNLIGTLNLLRALDKHVPKIRSILLASSANLYGNTEAKVITEATPVKPINDYSVSKFAMEHMASLWCDKLPIFITRPFNYTGVGQEAKFLIPKIVQHFKQRKKTIQLGNLDVWREFGDVRDVATIYVKLLELCPRAKTINICTGKAYSLQEVIELSCQISGHRLEVQVNPLFVRSNEVKTLVGDNSYLHSLAGNLKQLELVTTLSWMLGSPA